MARNERAIRVADLLGTGDSATLTLASAAAIYTQSFKVEDGACFAVGYYMTGATGSGNATIVMEQSFMPEGTAYAADANFMVPVGMPTIVSNLGSVGSTYVMGTWYYAALSPIAMPYARFKITGTMLNLNSLINIKVSQQVVD